MTVATTTARNVRDGNGVATSFVYDFVVLSSSHLKVYELVGTVLTLRTEGVHYSVTGVGNAGGGTVVFNTAPASVTPGTGNVVLQRAVPMTQAVHYVANDAFPESTHEAALDKLTMLVQQVSDAQSLGLQMPLNYTGSSEDVVADLLASSQTASAAADDAAASASAASISAAAAAAAAATVQSPEVQVHAAASKSTPVDNDETLLVDSAASNALKKLTWVNIKATLKTYFDTLYAAAGASSEITGVVKDYIGTSAPSGYVFLSGRTIGDASSGATERANADTSALFTLLWNSMANTEAAVSGGRGASAAADFAAHKTITLPDARGRVIAGKDNMGGTTASRITSGGSGITGTTLGTAGGAESVTLTAAQSGLPSHGHSISATYVVSGGTALLGSGGGTQDLGTPSVGSAGPSSASSAHQNTQPTLVLNKIIKL